MAFMMAFFIAASPLQQSLMVSADDLPADIDLPAEDNLPVIFKDAEEPFKTDESNDHDESMPAVLSDISNDEITDVPETPALPDESLPDDDNDEEQDETEESASATDTEGSEVQETPEDNNIITASSSDEYFRLISEFPDMERIIVDTDEDLSCLKVSYGVYFDGTYMLGFENSEDLVKAVELLSQMDCEYAMDGTLSVCGNGDDVHTKYSINPDAKVRVAVIDTGSDLANESYSVIGDDVSDHNGHGTGMCGHILSGTSDAYIISIKAIGDDGKGSMSDVYAAVQMAEDLGADYILMAVSIRNAGKYDAFISLIENTKADVIASAGNNGADASKYLPAGITGVTTVGALNDDGTLRSSSNYGDCVDYYVTADSTSDAAAIALGMIIAGRAGDLLTEPKDPSEIAQTEPDQSEDIPGYPEGGIAYTEDYYFEDDEVFTTNASLTAYCIRECYQNDYFRSAYNGEHYGVYSSSSANTMNSNLLYCIEDDVPGPDGESYSSYSTSVNRLLAVACACGPGGNLYSYAKAYLKANDTAGDLKNLSDEQWKEAMYGIVHWTCCRIVDGKWPARCPGTSSSCAKILTTFYSWINNFKGSTVTLDGTSYAISNVWTTRYSTTATNGNGETYQKLVRGGLTLTAQVPVSFTLNKTASTSVDPGYLSFAGTTYTLYDTCSVDKNTGSISLSSQLMTFTVDADGSATASYSTTVSGSESFYLKETAAASGYAKDDTVYEIRVDSYGSISVYETVVKERVDLSGPAAGSSVYYLDSEQTNKASVTNGTVSIVHVKDAPDKALFSLEKKLGSNYAPVAGRTYAFELWDNTDNVMAAAGTASVPSNATSSDSTPVVWTNIAGGFSASSGNKLVLIPGHSYQIMETTMSVNGSELDTPSGWTKGTAHGKSCFYQIFNTGAGKVYSFTVTNNVSVIPLSITKVSADSGITNNNGSYSLAGAKYVLAADTSFSTGSTVGTFTIKADGKSDTTLNVNRGATYFLKETVAATGYELDASVYKIVIAADGTAAVSTESGSGTASVTQGNPIIVNVKDVPKTTLISLTKSSAAPAVNGNNTCYSLANTSYCLYADQSDADAGVNALVTFTFDAGGTTNAKYQTACGKTYYLKEVSAGKGYKLDTAIYTVNVAADGSVSANNGASVTAAGNVFKINVKDEPGTAPLNIALKKVDKNGKVIHNANPSGATFRISYYAHDLGATGNNDAAATVIYNVTVKDTSATIKLSDLKAMTPAGGSDPDYLKNLPADFADFPYGTIRIEEISAPAGYRPNDQVVRFRLGTTVSFSVENNSSYGNRNYWKQLSDGTLELTELPQVGYYSLTKSLEDTDVRSSLAGFSYELWNVSSSASPVQIATGVSQTDGRVLWIYTVPDYYQNTDTSKLLTGTSTYQIELPAAEKNSAGNKAAVQYQVRELKNSIAIAYGNTGIPYTYAAPVTDGKAWSNASDYFYKTVTVTDETVTREGVINDYQYTGISVNKVVPANNPFDVTKVTFKLYNTDGGDALVANGSVDSKGNVTWHRTVSSGYGSSPASSVNTINYIPLGHYRVEETWDKEYVDANGVSVLIGEKNNNGWKKTEDDKSYTYSFDVDLSDLSNDGKITYLAVENEREVQEFNLVKNVTSAGDVSDITAELYLLDGNDEKLIATGTASTNGIGTYGFMWDYKGTHTVRDNLDTLVLPVGKYRVVELCPVTYYKNTGIPYTYMAPEGFKERTVGGTLQFYKDFELKSGEYATEKMSVTNVRIEGSFDIIKIERSGDDTSKEFTFEVYYRGNGNAASDTASLVENVTITTTDGKGSAALSELPEGWYEIRETGAGSSWTTTWLNDATISNGNKVVRLDSANRTNATPEVNDGVRENGMSVNAVVVYNDKAPEIGTVLVDAATGDHISGCDSETTLVDTVTYKNLLPGHYVMSGVLMDKKTGKEILDKNGNAITSEKSFDVADLIDEYGMTKPQSGAVKVTYTLDTTAIKDVAVVAFEELRKTSSSGDLIASHKDINDNAQTVFIPDIKTTLTDSVTNSHVTVCSDETKLVDTVTYSNLLPGKTYTLTGTLMDKKTGNPLGITAEQTFTPSAASGTVEIEFIVDTTSLKGFTAVAFETVSFEGKDVAIHADINDEDQTVEIPDIRTTLTDSATNDHVSSFSATTKLVDTVKYTNLIPGKEYTLTGTLTDKNTGDPLGIASSRKFTPDSASGTVTVEFEIDSTLIAGMTIVAFETVSFEGKDIAVHADINDEEQTVYVPGIRTTLTDPVTEDHVSGLGGKTTLIDTVSYHNLVAGKEYKVTGVLMNKKTGRLFADSEGNTYEVSKNFTAENESGKVEIAFTVDTTKINDVTVVAFENLYYNDVLVAVHTDINDVDQTLYIPKIRTTLKDPVTDDHIASEETVTLIDSVKYSNLLPGKEYTVTGILVNAETGEEIKIEGETVTSSVTFTPDNAEGSVEIVFEIDPEILRGTSVVAFEDLTYDSIKVATHADITDEEQTVRFPEIHTTLIDMTTDNHVSAQSGKIRLTDKVSYKNLKPGLTYVMNGTLYVKSTEEVLTDADGNPVTAMAEFIPDAEAGYVDLVFEFDSGVLKGESLVAFEELVFKDIVVATHNDINDRGQTVDIPDIHTTFFDAAFGIGEDLVRCDEEVVLTDRVFYQNLTPGLEYKLYMSVMVQDTGEPLLDKDGKVVTAEKTFIPDALEGYVDISVTVDATLSAGKSLVAFETLDYENITLVIHADINDKDQTVNIPDISTTATDADNTTHTLTFLEKVTIEDAVAYENLVIGKTYKITGSLYNKETGEEYLDAEGNAYAAEKEFTAVTSDGIETVVFADVIVPFDKIEIVVFEEIAEKETGIKIASHADLDDEGQTVRRPAVSTTATVLNAKEVWLEATTVTNITISDCIRYSGFENGRKYRAEATLYKTDGTQITAAGQPVLSIVEFVPEAPDGEVIVNTTFSSAGLSEGDRIVVFEKFYDVASEEEISSKTRTQDILVSRHEDLANEDQTITVHYRPDTGEIEPSYSTAGTVIASVASFVAFIWFVISRKRDPDETDIG